MPKKFTRADRVAQQIQRELADIICTELKDPRIGMITLTDVEVTYDLAYAKIFYTLMTGHGQVEESSKTLGRSAGFLRTQLSQRIKLFKIPALQFIFDNSIEYGVNLSQLIDKAVATDINDEEKQ